MNNSKPKETTAKGCFCQCHALNNFGWDQRTKKCIHCELATEKKLQSKETTGPSTPLRASWEERFDKKFGTREGDSYWFRVFANIKDFIKAEFQITEAKTREKVLREVQIMLAENAIFLSEEFKHELDTKLSQPPSEKEEK